MERHIKNRLNVFKSFTKDESPTDDIQCSFSSLHEKINDSFLSYSSTSSKQTEGSFYSDIHISTTKVSNPILNQTFSTLPAASNNFLLTKLSTTVSSVQMMADKYTRASEARKIEERMKNEESSPRKAEKPNPDRVINLSTEDSSKEEIQERGKPKKRPLYENEKKYFVVRMDLIKSGQDRRTTIMIKNIPNKYTQKMLLQTIDKKFSKSYDFLYLPIDFKNRCNVGYAFINFIDFRVIVAFFQEFNEKRWEKFNSEKICAIAYARIQGLNELVQHFQNSSVINQDDNKVKPVILPRH